MKKARKKECTLTFGSTSIFHLRRELATDRNVIPQQIVALQIYLITPGFLDSG